MSSLLKQAIIDANLLKESAEKQAEKTILEKYSSEIKDVYESMLEAAPDPLADMAGEMSAERDLDFDFEDDLDFEGDSMDAQVPYSFADGEELMGAPDEEEEIEIDFDKLAAMLGDVEPDVQMDEPMDMGLAGDEDAEDMEMDMGATDELPLEEAGEIEKGKRFKVQSKAMGNAPEDRMKNVSPHVKDKDVKKDVSKSDVIDVNEGEGAVCEKCGMTHMGEDCLPGAKHESEKLPPTWDDKLGKIPDEDVDAHLQTRIEQAYEAYTEYTKAAKAAQRFPGKVSSQSGPMQHFEKKAEEARKEYIRLNNILRNRQTAAAGGDPDDDYSASKPSWMKEDNELEEKIVMDDTGNKSGWTSRATDILSHELDKKAAHDKFDKTDGEEFKDGDYKKDLEKKNTEYDSLKEDYNKLKSNFKENYKEISNLREENNNYKLKVEELSKKNKQFLSLLERAQIELQDNDLKMAKLFYENKVFRDASLNERQKNNIVEVISEIDTAEQIKPVYEALLKTKGTVAQKRESSNPLQEALKNRPKIARMAAATKVSGEPKEQQVSNDALTERMQKLAGIKK